MMVRAPCNNFMKLGGFIFASVCAWYFGSLLASIIPEDSLASAFDNLQNVAEKPKLKAPLPKRLKCDHWSPCSPGSYAYRILSGGGQKSLAKICFEDQLLMSKESQNVGRGINVAIVDYNTGKLLNAKSFDMWQGAFSAPLADFVQKAPQKSLLLMVTYDDGSSRLMEDAKKAIADLGSKEIRNLKFRSSWAFIAAKGFELPANTQREMINHSDAKKNRYNGWPAEVQIEGCIPKN
ncbi:protein FAM3B [Lacerta agilis]|uniref:protein FAM3B n=1 Tax=Lacerta agilis TaxID=80427 RepID=UPI00141A1C67|nr:protein FAM3B [Lacerta agilis]